MKLCNALALFSISVVLLEANAKRIRVRNDHTVTEHPDGSNNKTLVAEQAVILQSETPVVVGTIIQVKEDVNKAIKDALKAEEEVQKREDEAKKYFHEPGWGEDTAQSHYDLRFYRRELSYDERRETQLHMLRAYLMTFEQKGLQTWIAHGTLLGWWWNGKMLPWDRDIDVQVSESTLFRLGEQYNQTKYRYVDNDTSPQWRRDYFLDVNRYIGEREREDGMNIIDARWIDMENGMYIDITGLSETHPDVQPTVWVDKNYHRYKIDDLYPMRRSVFEGVRVLIPYAYQEILLEEYTDRVFTTLEYEHHNWDPAQNEWIPDGHQAASGF